MATNIPIQIAPVAGQVVVYQSNTGHPPSSLNWKAALITGYMQIVLAIATVGFSVVCISTGCTHVFPIFAALAFYLVAGILGVIAGHSKGRNECAIVGCMVMSILAAIIAFIHVIECGSNQTSNDGDSSYVVNLLNILIGVIELLTAIVASHYMCSGAACCCGKQTANAIVLGQPPYASYVVQPGQGANQGQVAVQGYPTMQQQYVGQPIVMGQSQVMGQPQAVGQPQVMGQPQQNIQYMAQAHAQPPAYTEHETKEVPQMHTVV